VPVALAALLLGERGLRGRVAATVTEVQPGRLPDDRQDVAEHDVVDRALGDAPVQLERDLGFDRDLAELDIGLAGLLERVIGALLALRDAEVNRFGAQGSRCGRQHVISDLLGLVDIAVDANPDADLAERVLQRCLVLVHDSTFRPS